MGMHDGVRRHLAPLGAQGGPKDLLAKLGEDDWEAFAVSPPTPPPGEGDDPDASSYDIIPQASTAVRRQASVRRLKRR